MEVDINDHLESKYDGLYIIGDGSGVTHSLHMPQQAVYLLQEIFAIKYRLNKQKYNYL